MPLQIAHLLNTKLQANPMWRQLAEKLEDIINATVGEATDEALNAIGNPYRHLRGQEVDPRKFSDITPVTDGGITLLQMRNDRDTAANVRVVLPADGEGNSHLYMDLDGQTYVATTKAYHDREILIQEAKALGFDFFSDDLSDADYARVLLFISQYWPRAGSHQSLANFIGFVRNIRVDLVQLWTVDDDEDDFLVLERFNNRMSPVWDGGVYYPTFHYDLHYDAFADTDVEELRRLFFALAPIHLVLRRMVETIRSTAQAYAGAGPAINAVKSLRWKPQAQTLSRQIKYRFVSTNINMPLPLMPANLNPNGLSVMASGPHGVWILERDPAVALPSDPVKYMLEHGIYVSPSNDPDDKFVFPAHGIFNSGLWVMAEVPNTGCLIEIT